MKKKKHETKLLTIVISVTYTSILVLKKTSVDSGGLVAKFDTASYEKVVWYN